MELLETTAFEQFGLLAGTDKISHHGYQRFYPRFLNPFRVSATGILEIGIDQKKSLQLWLDYFQNAFIYGIDISFSLETDRIKIIKADQSSSHELRRVVQEIKHPIQVIIDDGSHIPEHQLLSFDILFSSLLQPGGVYIVEDIETSYWKNDELYHYKTNYGFRHPRSFIEISKLMIDAINYEFLNQEARAYLQKHLPLSEQTRQLIATMTYGQNCVIFTKKTDTKYEERVYRFEDKIL